MNPMVFVYLGERFLFRIADFLRHWYRGSARVYFNFILDRFHSLDRVLAFRITLRHLFEPLYGDYTLIGRLVGLPLRLLRLAVAGLVYVVLGGAAILVYLAWLVLPVYLVARVFA
jgi:hypothetical protein